MMMTVMDHQQHQQQSKIVLTNVTHVRLYKLNSFLLSKNGPTMLCSTLASLFPNAQLVMIRNESLQPQQQQQSSVLLHRIIPEALRPDELRYLVRYKIYSLAEMPHVGRHGHRCMTEKRDRKLRMWGDEYEHYEFQ